MFRLKRMRPKAGEIRESKFFIKAKAKATEYLLSPDSMNQLLDKAIKKARKKRGPLNEVWEFLMASIRLFKAYTNGSYQEIPWQSLVMILASIIYFVMPVDVIPDILAGVGYLDDATLLAWTVRSFAADIEKFTEWESRSA